MRAAQIVAGLILGLVLVEAGLRIRFAEHEADRLYWGRGAFVAADGFSYRHAPSQTAWVGRSGRFAHTVTTNARGYRDARLPDTATTGPRVMVAGASFAFGLGLADPDALFHVQLERLLRERRDWPDDVVVFNVSQTGYSAESVSRLAQAEFRVFDPDVVIQLMSHAFAEQIFADSDIVDGYRLPRDRPWAGTLLDRLRTRSFTWMRSANPLRRGVAFHVDRWWAADPEPTTPQQTPAEIHERFAHFLQLLRELRQEGIPLLVAPIAGARGMAPALERMRVNVIRIPEERSWTPYLPDLHWNARGHREAAAFAAARLPPYRVAKRMKQSALERGSERP